jgi:uncharacterized protein
VSVPDEQAEVAAFLARETGRPPQETHVSAVFLGERDVFKLKKAVRLPFLDFSTRDRRRHFLERELAVNRRGAPELYRAVVEVRRVGGRLVLGGEEGEVVEPVLRMARVPEEDFLEAIVAAGRVTPALLDALGDAVAAYHAGLGPAEAGDPHAAMVEVAEGNARSAREAGLPEAQVAAWRAGMLAGLDIRRDWLRARAAAGFVRRAHGDLHLGNLCLWDGRPVLFDALEFDEAMATIDLGYDLAFLLMDLDLRVGRAAANRVMNRYVARSGDVGMLRGLAPFLSMRAMIRAHVEARRGREWGAYLDAALAYLAPASPVAVAIGGLQGTGKTTLARLLAPGLGAAPGALHLRSDEWRKRLHGRDFGERLPAEAYAAAANERTNVALIAALREAAESGQAAIVDATFLDPAQRVAAREAAGGRLVGIWLEAPLAELERRVAARQGDASDATVAVLRQAAAQGVGPGDWLAVDATDRDAALALIRTHATTC